MDEERGAITGVESVALNDGLLATAAMRIKNWNGAGSASSGDDRVTKVTFTPLPLPSTIQSWFGSSGGGLPGRPEHSSGRFFL